MAFGINVYIGVCLLLVYDPLRIGFHSPLSSLRGAGGASAANVTNTSGSSPRVEAGQGRPGVGTTTTSTVAVTSVTESPSSASSSNETEAPAGDRNNATNETTTPPNATAAETAVTEQEEVVFKGRGVLNGIEKSLSLYEIPKKMIPATVFKSRLRQNLQDIGRTFQVRLPPNRVLISEGIYSSNFTHRFVYAPVGSRLELPCSKHMKQLTIFNDFRWRLFGRKLMKRKDKQDRVKSGLNMNIVFDSLDSSDTGQYECSAYIKKVFYRNIVDVRVFSLAEVAIGFPLKFRVAHCNKHEETSIGLQIKKTLCRRSFPRCPFDFSVFCLDDFWHGQRNYESLPALMEILVVKHTVKEVKEVARCNGTCIMKLRVDRSLAEAVGFIEDMGFMYDNMLNSSHCTSVDCAKDYTFLPDPTLAEISPLYSCRPGYALYRTSSCVPCYPGSYAPSRGPNENCRPCPANTYQPRIAATDCYACREPSVNLMATGATNRKTCQESRRKKLARYAAVGSIIAVGSIVGLIIIFCIVCRKRVKKIWQSGNPQPIPKSHPDEKAPLNPSAMGQELATGLRKTSTLYFPQQGLPPPTGPGGAAAAAAGGPSAAAQSQGTLFTAGAQTPNPLSETMTTAPTVHSPPGSTVQPVSTAPPSSSPSFSATSTSAVTGMTTSTSGAAAVGTPISIDSNAQPTDVIKKAMDKVAPNMKLQSLKIKTGNETNVLTLPPDFGAPHTAPGAAAAPSQAASTTAASATTVGVDASHPPPPAPVQAQAAAASSASHAPPTSNTFVTTPYAPPEAQH